jgi:hypothetical protein
MLAVGFHGFLAWLALLMVNAAQDFGGRIPRRWASPVFLAHRFPPGGPDAVAMAEGIERCIAEGLARWDGEELALDPELYEEWRAPMSNTERSRKHRAQRHATAYNDTQRPATDATPETLPDQTRPDQTRPEPHTDAAGVEGISGPGQSPKSEGKAKRKRRSPPSGTAINLALRLRDAIQMIKPDHKVVSHFESATRLAWARDIDLMLTCDGRSEERIRAAIAYIAKGHEYTPVILSGKALREKFDSLEIAQQRHQRKASTASKPAKLMAADMFDLAARMETLEASDDD